MAIGNEIGLNFESPLFSYSSPFVRIHLKSASSYISYDVTELLLHHFLSLLAFHEKIYCLYRVGNALRLHGFDFSGNTIMQKKLLQQNNDTLKLVKYH